MENQHLYSLQAVSGLDQYWLSSCVISTFHIHCSQKPSIDHHNHQSSQTHSLTDTCFSLWWWIIFSWPLSMNGWNNIDVIMIHSHHCFVSCLQSNSNSWQCPQCCHRVMVGAAVITHHAPAPGLATSTIINSLNQCCRRLSSSAARLIASNNPSDSCLVEASCLQTL